MGTQRTADCSKRYERHFITMSLA